MLFMLFAEGQDGQKGSLPVHSKVYQLGYSIEKIRSLECVPFLDDNGNFIQQTLERAFRIYYDGYATEKSMVHNNATGRDEIRTNALGFSFPAVGTDLFSAAKTSLFKDVVISDRAMQEVIRKLSLAKTGSGKSARTQRVHYAGLGLNQLGAVYEGLLALKPVILSERVILLKKESKDLAHRYVPHSKRTEYDAELFETDDRGHPVDRKEGTFLLAPVGLERKFSASFYTPEVLTRFVAKEAVDVLLEKDSSLKRMESLKICEPAMGSGAFLNAVVDDLAKRMGAEYSKIDQTKMKAYRDRCEASGKPFRKDEAPAFYEMPYYVAKAKEHLMTHAVHGVDLNPTAVELAKISLWLNCLHENGNLPFLDFKLKHGNSLVGGWVKRHEIEVAGKKFPHFFVPRTESVKSHLDGLVLGLKEMPFIQDANVRRHVQTVQASWDAAMNDRSHLARLEKLSSRVMALYESHVKVRRQYRDKLQAAATAEAKKHAFEQFVSEDSAYNQLRAMMDYWCALWFWPNAELRHLPTFDSYLRGLEWLASNQLPYGAADKEKVLRQAGSKDLPIALRVAVEQCFFHWDLEFSEVFEEGGFDLVLGNPPWAPVRWEEEDFFEAVRPGMHAQTGDAKAKQIWYKREIAAHPNMVPSYVNAKAGTLSFVNFISDSATYPFSDQSKANTYKYFFQRFVQTTRDGGAYAILAQDGVLTEDSCSEIRANVMRDMRRVYRFHNELRYFEDIGHTVQFMCGFHVKGGADIGFHLIDNLYDVSTIDACRKESRNAHYIGTKTDQGKWDLRGHPDRIVLVDRNVLATLSSFIPGVKWDVATIPVIHGKPELEVLIRFAKHESRLRDLDWNCWLKFDEAAASKAGLIQRAPCKAESINEAVFTGPNIFVGNPANKSVNPTAKSHGDFRSVDLVDCNANFFADCVYRVTEKGLKSPEYLAKTPWGAVHNHQYRIFSRGLQVNTTGARTFSSAIFPRMCSHISQICSLSFKSNSTLVIMSGLFNSLVFDFLVRAWSGGSISKSLLETMPALNREQMNSPLVPALMVRALRLGCISAHYSDLWKEVWSSEFQDVEFESPFSPKLAYSKLKAAWEFDVCIREKSQREQALCEIDVIVAELFGFDKDTLLKLYRSQFGVLQGNLQDHPGQKVDPEKYHFPRYKQLSDAFDQLQRVKPHRLKPAS
jgi:hypothetical protein